MLVIGSLDGRVSFSDGYGGLTGEGSGEKRTSKGS